MKPKRESGKISSYTPIFLVLAMGIIASIIAYTTVRDSLDNQARTAFTSLAITQSHIVVEGFSQAIFATASIGALFNASELVSLTEFTDFTTPLLQRFPTITALCWVPQVQRDERVNFEQVAQQSSPGFHITERNAENMLVDSAAKPSYFPVTYILPHAGNELAVGFDLYSNAIRRAAIDLAIDTAQTTSTARIRLVQDQGSSYSVLLIHPIFAKSASAAGPSLLQGVATAVYRIGAGVEQALSQFPSAALNIWLFDRSGAPGEQFLYFRSADKAATGNEQSPVQPVVNEQHYSHAFTLGGRQFELILSPDAKSISASSGYQAWLTLCAGLGFTCLLVAYLQLVLRRDRELFAGQVALEHQINERQAAEQLLRKANQSLEILSREDSLMGIANRRRFDEYLEQEWSRAMRDRTSLSLIIGDVDFFKAYNDAHGHVAGDECLRKIAKAVADVLERSGDMVARYGGEEIAIVLPATPAEGAYNLAEKVRLAVSNLALPQTLSGDAEVVTLSVGCGTVVPEKESAVVDFVQAVDAALYSAKQQGRNRTVVL
jgi:diguanylate cyclase (GGDEF)-like protein